MRRVDRQRGQHRKDLFLEMLLQPRLLVLGELAAGDAGNAFALEQRHQVGKALLLVFLKPLHLAQQVLELLLGRAAVRALELDALAHLAGEAGDPHHEELVQIVGRDREEAHPLQQRVIDVVRFLQHAPVELQPGELPVHETVGIAADGRGGLGSGEFGLHRLQLGHVPLLSSVRRLSGSTYPLARFCDSFISSNLQTDSLCSKRN